MSLTNKGKTLRGVGSIVGGQLSGVVEGYCRVDRQSQCSCKACVRFYRTDAKLSFVTLEPPFIEPSSSHSQKRKGETSISQTYCTSWTLLLLSLFASRPVTIQKSSAFQFPWNAFQLLSFRTPFEEPPALSRSLS